MVKFFGVCLEERKIAVNAIFLFGRMLVMASAEVLAVGIVLRTLGETGYGVYSAVTGVALLFLTAVEGMELTARRFISCAMGAGTGTRDVSSAFTAVLQLSLLLAGAAVLLGETIGLWFASSRISVPAGFLNDVPFVFRMAEVVVVLKLVQLPFSALIYSAERMSVLAAIGLIDALLTVLAALAARWQGSLAVFASAIAAGSFCTFVLQVVCALRVYPVRIVIAARLNQIAEMGRFFLWGCLGASGNLLKYRGTSIALSVYAGVVFNATWESSLRIGCLLGALTVSYQLASAPVIYKFWAEGPGADVDRRLGRILLVVMALAIVPASLIFVFAPHVIRFWLDADLPPQIVAFVRCFCLNVVVDAFSAPLTTGILATGKVALYQSVAFSFSAAGFLGGWVALACGQPPWVAVAAVVASNALAGLYRLLHLWWFAGVRLRLV